ncbi:unnamed protein product [Amoebophrya sp. A120]|nr:unnamed protein product [Amoebophrya sp. A120]|eukprot:GSA120T00026070001.1
MKSRKIMPQHAPGMKMLSAPGADNEDSARSSFRINSGREVEQSRWDAIFTSTKNTSRKVSHATTTTRRAAALLFLAVAARLDAGVALMKVMKSMSTSPRQNQNVDGRTAGVQAQGTTTPVSPSSSAAATTGGQHRRLESIERLFDLDQPTKQAVLKMKTTKNCNTSSCGTAPGGPRASRSAEDDEDEEDEEAGLHQLLSQKKKKDAHYPGREINYTSKEVLDQAPFFIVDGDTPGSSRSSIASSTSGGSISSTSLAAGGELPPDHGQERGAAADVEKAHLGHSHCAPVCGPHQDQLGNDKVARKPITTATAATAADENCLCDHDNYEMKQNSKDSTALFTTSGRPGSGSAASSSSSSSSGSLFHLNEDKVTTSEDAAAASRSTKRSSELVSLPFLVQERRSNYNLERRSTSSMIIEDPTLSEQEEHDRRQRKRMGASFRRLSQRKTEARRGEEVKEDADCWSCSASTSSFSSRTDEKALRPSESCSGAGAGGSSLSALLNLATTSTMTSSGQDHISKNDPAGGEEELLSASCEQQHAGGEVEGLGEDLKLAMMEEQVRKMEQILGELNNPHRISTTKKYDKLCARLARDAVVEEKERQRADHIAEQEEQQQGMPLTAGGIDAELSKTKTVTASSWCPYFGAQQPAALRQYLEESGMPVPKLLPEAAGFKPLELSPLVQHNQEEDEMKQEEQRPPQMSCTSSVNKLVKLPHEVEVEVVPRNEGIEKDDDETTGMRKRSSSRPDDDSDSSPQFYLTSLSPGGTTRKSWPGSSLEASSEEGAAGASEIWYGVPAQEQRRTRRVPNAVARFVTRNQACTTQGSSSASSCSSNEEDTEDSEVSEEMRESDDVSNVFSGCNKQSGDVEKNASAGEQSKNVNDNNSGEDVLQQEDSDADEPSRTGCSTSCTTSRAPATAPLYLREKSESSPTDDLLPFFVQPHDRSCVNEERSSCQSASEIMQLDGAADESETHADPVVVEDPTDEDEDLFHVATSKSGVLRKLWKDHLSTAAPLARRPCVTAGVLLLCAGLEQLCLQNGVVDSGMFTRGASCKSCSIIPEHDGSSSSGSFSTSTAWTNILLPGEDHAKETKGAELFAHDSKVLAGDSPDVDMFVDHKMMLSSNEVDSPHEAPDKLGTARREGGSESDVHSAVTEMISRRGRGNNPPEEVGEEGDQAELQEREHLPARTTTSAFDKLRDRKNMFGGLTTLSLAAAATAYLRSSTSNSGGMA